MVVIYIIVYTCRTIYLYLYLCLCHAFVPVYLSIYESLYLSLVLWKCATPCCLASIVLPVVVLWFFMRCSGGCVLFVVVVDRAFEPVGDRSRFDHSVVGSFHGGRNAEPSTFPSF
jgi:hypothetical protein